MARGTYRETLTQPGLRPFLWTQFLGALNDNVFKIIVSLLALDTLGLERGAWVVGAIFIGPFLLFSGYAGGIADRHSKRRVLIAMKGLEVVAMGLAVAGLIAGNLIALLAVLFLMAAQSTFFSPAKYGLLPETLDESHLSRANGLLEMSTFAAIVLGTALGGELFQRSADSPWLLGGVLVLIALAGLATSFGIRAVPAAVPAASPSTASSRANPWSEIARGLSSIQAERGLWMTVAGLSFFWFLGALLQMALLPFGEAVLQVSDAAATRLYTPLAVGIAAGSLIAGRLSGDRIEPGLVPIGAIGLGVFSLIFATTSTYAGAAIALAGLGLFGGLFAVPLNAIVQQRPAATERGRILATNNVVNTIGILLASAVLAVFNDAMGLSIETTLAVVGVVTLASGLVALAAVPDYFARFIMWLATHTIYRIRITGREHIPHRGPALLVANHLSMADGLIVGACVQRFVRFLVYAPYFQRRGLNGLLRRVHAIPVSSGNRRDIARAIASARTALEDGHVVCIFAEGAVSRTGNMLPFRRGVERIASGLNAPIIPVHLDGLWGSIFSFEREKFFWKLPKRLPYPVTVSFGAPLPSWTTAGEVRMAISELGTSAAASRYDDTDLLHTRFMRIARRHWNQRAMADSTGQDITYGKALIGALALGRVVARKTEGQEHVGVLLPASVGAAMANLATHCADRVPVNLNFTIGPDAMSAAIEQAGISTILTSRRFLSKAEIPERPGMVFLEDLRKEIGTAAKLRAAAEARLTPLGRLTRRYAGSNRTPDSLATIIFSSGSTGQPKGVMITHRNIQSNIDSLRQIFPLGGGDCFIGVLPLFHSFGLTGTFWFPLMMGCQVVYHPNPMDAKTVGELAGKFQASMLISTPTFCQSYIRRCTPEQFASLKYAIVGAEKLREPVAKAFREKYGVDLLEGYGCTEMAPVVACNRPNVGAGSTRQTGTKAGSVGHPIPGVTAKVVDQETGEGPLVNREGLLLVKGPNMMAGYLDQPERTAEVIKDGWYVTGDIASIDEDGFIHITDRLSRFSKIGGEMVPHIKVEDAINELVGEACSAVTAVPDATRGERLVAFYTRRDITPDALWDLLSSTSLPKIWLPRRDALVPIDEIPALGTGKVDLRRLRDMAASLSTAAGTTVSKSARATEPAAPGTSARS